MDFQKLTELFPNLKRVQSEPEDSFSFRIQGQLYAIPEKDLTPEQQQLILAFSDEEPLHTKEELKWIDFLHNQTDQPPRPIDAFRFNVIHIQDQINNPAKLKQSISLLLNKPILFIWHHTNQFVLLEELTDQEPIPFEKIIDVMSDDLDLNLKIMVSDPLTSIEEAPQFYQWLCNTAELMFDETSKRLVNQEDALLQLLPNKYTADDRHYYARSILQDSIYDHDLIKTIATVIEHHGNVTAAAKSLYMHRNSVQYRIDKFQDLTGKDIKVFKEMMNVYLAIQLIES